MLAEQEHQASGKSFRSEKIPAPAAEHEKQVEITSDDDPAADGKLNNARTRRM